VGIATVADSLAAIQQIVYNKKQFTLPDFMAIVRNNFDGHEQLRQEILHNCPHYGNNDDRADRWAVTVADLLFDVVVEVNGAPEYLIVPALYSLHLHFQLGDDFPATPDGRKKGDFLSENQSPTHGADRSGLTALLQSAAKLPNWRTLEGGLNVRLSGKVEPEHFISIMETFFDMGGQHLGVTVIDKEILLDAREYPENYEELCVRITGFSAYFNTLSPEGKQDIINRTDY
jgi:formate C-acetyltransferase